jgi:hypothetical protein
MGRAKGGANRASTRQPRGRRPRRTRPQITIPDSVRDLIERRLEELPLDRDALKLGTAQFGEDFDLERFREAFDARDPEQRNRARLVTGNLQALADGMVELVREAATLTGLRPAGRRPEANPDIEAVRADGGLTGRQASELIQLKKLANDIRHIYVTVTADDVHAGVDRLLKLLPDFMAAYRAWLGEYGVSLK